MDTKLLTISIAAHNVDQYIKQTLDSLVNSSCVDELEIFIIGDGGNDNTISIAKQYQKRFPNSIFPIEKENGGYGSTVNYSLANASGKYFKLLDGDDWFDTEALEKFVNKLRIVTADVVVTNYSKYVEGRLEDSVIFAFEKKNQVVNINDYRLPIIGMWGLCYKTSILRESNLILPEYTLYTDQIFATYPFVIAQSIVFFDLALYCYRLGRDGQSVSRESRIKNIDQNLYVLNNLVEFYESNKSNFNSEYIARRVAASYINIFKTYLLFAATVENLENLKKFDQQFLTQSSRIYKEAEKFGNAGLMIKVFRKTNYLIFWALKLLPNGFPNWA